MALALMMIVGVNLAHTSEVQAATYITGCFNGNDYGSPFYTYYTAKSRSAQKIKIATYYQNGKKSPGYVDVMIKNRDNQQVTSVQTVKSGSTITLNYGYEGYMIVIRRSQKYRYSGYDNNNKCYYVAIDAVSNCQVYSSNQRPKNF